MSEPQDPMKVALDALGRALQKAAVAAATNPQVAPYAEKAAAVLGSTVDALANDASAGREALSGALASVTSFVSDAASSDPERRAAATAKLTEIQQRLAGPESTAHEIGARAASWAQEVAKGAEASPASERLSELWGTVKASYERVQAKEGEPVTDGVSDTDAAAPGEGADIGGEG
jgi:hypothetical protein